jgi:hypothetical protein
MAVKYYQQALEPGRVVKIASECWGVARQVRCSDLCYERIARAAEALRFDTPMTVKIIGIEVELGERARTFHLARNIWRLCLLS